MGFLLSLFGKSEDDDVFLGHRTEYCVDCKSYDWNVFDGELRERCGIHGTGNCHEGCTDKRQRDPNYRWTDKNRWE